MRRFQAIVVALAVGSAWLPAAAQAQKEQVIHVPDFADFLAVDGDSVWATNRGRVERWSRKGKLAEVPMARPCGAMAVDHGSLWVADCEAHVVNRIDLKTARLVAAIPVAISRNGERNVVAGAGSIWVASDAESTVSRIDPATNKVIATVPTSPGVSYMTFGFGALWAVSGKGDTLEKIDPTTNSVVKKTMLGKQPGFLAAGVGAVWVQEQLDGTLARIDPQSGEIVTRVKVGDNLKYGDIDIGDGKVWLRTTDDQVFAVVDPKTNKVSARVGKAAGSGALRYSSKGVWTTAHDEHTLTWWPVSGKIGK